LSPTLNKYFLSSLLRVKRIDGNSDVGTSIQFADHLATTLSVS
jgi:hypothetical protein